MIESPPTWVALAVVAALLVLGAAAVAALHASFAMVLAGGQGLRRAVVDPWRMAVLLLAQQRSRTERYDGVTWALAPAAYVGLAAAAVTVVPLSRSFAVADVQAGIVVFGTAEALAIVAIFLHGWAPNSLMPMIGGYRFVALALSYELLSMFVLIAVAVPAQSLQVSAIVADQQGLWNVLRQPLGLPLFLVAALGVALWGPLNVADSADLAGGTQSETSGAHRLLWLVARAAMLSAFALMAATAFLGGWLGPGLPGPAWLALKTLFVLAILVAAGHLVGRIAPERLVTVLWTVALPLAFVDLAVAGLTALP